MSRKIGPIIVAGSLIFCISVRLHAASSKLAKELTATEANSVVNVIVQYRDAVTEAKVAKVEGRGGKLNARLDHIKAAAYTIRAADLSDLTSASDVLYVSPDRPVSAVTLSADYKAQAVLADMVQRAGWTGAGI